MKLKSFLLAFFFLATCSVQAAVVDTLSVYSDTMKKKIQVVVVSPENKKVLAPVIYLLHGHGGDAKTWISIKPELKEIADRDHIIFVCPDGSYSWYWDSPVDPSFRYETFVSGELIKYVDSSYPTIKDRTARAIAGLSMGGHGAMWLSFRHKELYGAAGSTSGGVDIRPFPNNWNMSKLLGKEDENQSIWDSHTVINQINHLQNGDLALIIDCGYSDFFFDVNTNFHKMLLENKIDHDFLVRPGAHNGEYWKNSMDYQILFFKKYFDKAIVQKK